MSVASQLPSPRPPGKPWSVGELREHLGISDRHMRRLISAGKVRVLRLGRRVLVSDDEASRLMTEGVG
jgi:excisionase family DNA binding protein